MKLLVVTDNMPSLTAGNILEQIRLFQHLGHQVSVLAWRSDPTHLTEEWRATIDELTVAYPPCTFQAGLRRFARRLRSAVRHPASLIRALAGMGRGGLATTPRHILNGYLSSQVEAYARVASADACVANFGPNCEVALCLQLLLGRRIPTIAYFRGYDMLPEVRGVPIRDAYPLTPANAFPVTNSEFARTRLLSHGLPFAHPVKVIPNSVDCDRFCPPGEPSQPRQGPLRLLSVGRLTQAKGLHTAIEALGLLQKRGIRTEYTVVGSGPDRAELEERAATLGIADSVRFTGPQFGAELRRRFQEAELFLFLSRRSSDGGEETQGVALVQAQACGLAAIASRIGGIPENLVEGKSGWLVEEGAAEAVAAKLEWFQDHPAELAGFRQAARQFALRERSTTGAISRRWSEFLERVRSENRTERSATGG